MDFTVLGSLSAQDGSRAVDLGGPRQRAVLGLLLIARGSIVPADRIVTTWEVDRLLEWTRRAR